MKLSIDKVKHVAKLANLPLTDDELKLYSNQLSKILDYIDQIEKADTTGVEPTYNVTGEVNVLREDTPGESLSQKDALQNANLEKNGFFVTKGVFNEE